jgi:hypothetical protein
VHVRETGTRFAEHALGVSHQHRGRVVVPPGVRVIHAQPWQAEPIMLRPIQHNAVLTLWLVLGDHQQPRHVRHERRRGIAHEHWHVRAHEAHRWGQLLDPAQRATSRIPARRSVVEVVDGYLLVERACGVRLPLEYTEHQGVAVSHEMAADQRTRRVAVIET